jgi:dolichol kinase
MSEALALEMKPVVLELHRLLRDIDPSRWRADLEQAVRRRIAELEAAVSRLLAGREDAQSSDEGPSARRRELRDRVAELVVLLRAEVPEPGLPPGELGDTWRHYRKRLTHTYESLRDALHAWRVDVPAIRPTNYTRTTFHVLNALICVVLLEVFLGPTLRWVVPASIAGTFWSLELLRMKSPRAAEALMAFFRPIAHPHERHKVNSSTWFATAMTILGALFDPMLAVAAIAVLGLADPAAAFVGRRWGRTQLVGSRSLEGSLTFLLAGVAAAFGVLAIWHADLAIASRLAVAVGAALAGCIAELLSRRVDDNFSVPMAAAAGGWLALWIAG